MSVCCFDCKYLVKCDYGYSDYTVEGTTGYCLKNLNPGLPKDCWYEENRDRVPWTLDNCPGFQKGDVIFLNVEFEYEKPEDYTKDPELLALLVKHFIFLE